jgi:hypothetical protein
MTPETRAPGWPGAGQHVAHHGTTAETRATRAFWGGNNGTRTKNYGEPRHASEPYRRTLCRVTTHKRPECTVTCQSAVESTNGISRASNREQHRHIASFASGWRDEPSVHAVGYPHDCSSDRGTRPTDRPLKPHLQTKSGANASRAESNGKDRHRAAFANGWRVEPSADTIG